MNNRIYSDGHLLDAVERKDAEIAALREHIRVLEYRIENASKWLLNAVATLEATTTLLRTTDAPKVET